MEKQSYFRIKMQAAIDRLIENSLKPFDPFGFSQFLEQNKSQPVPYELKSQETRETLYIIQNEMRKNLHEFINQQVKKSNIQTLLDQFESSYFQRICMKNIGNQWDEREFLICVEGYTEDVLINQMIIETLFDQLQQ